MANHYAFPSPARSPSLNALLNPSPSHEHPNSAGSNGNDPHDYFSEGNGGYFQEEPESGEGGANENGAGSITVSSTASVSPMAVGGNGEGPYANGTPTGGGPSGFRHLLSPSEPTPSPPLVHAKETKRKRPRATELLQPTGEVTENEIDQEVSGEVEQDMPPPRKRPVGTDSPTRSASEAVPSPPPPPANLAPPPSLSRPSSSSDSQSLELEPSIFNVAPIDEFTREVADWLWGFGGSSDWNVLEIEAKIGLLVDTRSRGNPRIGLPVPIETILTDDSGLRFESNMTINQHKAYNKLLNSLVENTASPDYPFAPIRYSHTRETDSFHQAPGGRKIRFTKGAKEGDRCVEKVRVADMNVFSPKRGFDWRLSVSLETAAPPPNTPPTMQRHKDRISYSHQMFQIDLTQVTLPSAPSPKPVTHELEIEFKDARVLMREAQKDAAGEESRYLEMVQCFLNNIRMLVRNAADP